MIVQWLVHKTIALFLLSFIIIIIIFIKSRLHCFPGKPIDGLPFPAMSQRVDANNCSSYLLVLNALDSSLQMFQSAETTFLFPNSLIHSPAVSSFHISSISICSYMVIMKSHLSMGIVPTAEAIETKLLAHSLTHTLSLLEQYIYIHKRPCKWNYLCQVPTCQI